MAFLVLAATADVPLLRFSATTVVALREQLRDDDVPLD